MITLEQQIEDLETLKEAELKIARSSELQYWQEKWTLRANNTQELIDKKWKEMETRVEDLTYGTDVRGDRAYFIDEKHLHRSSWIVSEEADTGNQEPTFFRIIKLGQQMHLHGWLEGRKIVQWG